MGCSWRLGRTVSCVVVVKDGGGVVGIGACRNLFIELIDFVDRGRLLVGRVGLFLREW